MSGEGTTIYQHNAAPLAPFLARDDVTELVINEPGWIGVETRKGWEWHEALLDHASLMTLAKADRRPHQTGHHDRIPHLLLGPSRRRARPDRHPACRRTRVRVDHDPQGFGCHHGH
jgi:hypothetical protein